MMYTKEDVLQGKVKQTTKTLANGQTGTGKTYFAMTHPKFAYLGLEPNGMDTAKSNPKLLDNMVWADEFLNSPTEDMKVTFERLDKAIELAHKDQADGKVETLILDNLTYLSENRWIYINKYEPLRTSSGALDTRGMYGTLSRWLYNFTITRILPFKGNVVVTAHVQTEGDEAMENKVDKSMTISPAILGGFRHMVAGMFSASLYLDKKRVGENKYMYLARCQKGANCEAKNRYNLPEIVENVSYQAIIDSIGKGAVTPTK